MKTPLKDLPEKYYLTHFLEVIDFLSSHYVHCFEPNHTQFLNDFYSLTEDAQCTYVRMVNRKGVIFKKSEFLKYKEIENLDSAFSELNTQGFTSSLSDPFKYDLIEYLKKPDLRKWLLDSGFKPAASLSKQDQVELAQNHLSDLSLNTVPDYEDLLVQGRSEDLKYLLFLYFGKIQTDLNLHTLRDLGIRETNSKTKFRPRYQNTCEAKAEYFFSHSPSAKDDFNLIYEQALSFQDLKSSTRILRDEFLLKWARHFEDTNPEWAQEILSTCEQPPSREKRIRFLYKRGEKDQARELLDEILENPRSDEELLFAEDFFHRKFNKKKTGRLTQILKEAQEISLSDFYFRRPEEGIRAHFKNMGFETYFTENELWNSLFGLQFWDELFESDKSQIFNPFERSPVDLVSDDFYLRQEVEIELLRGAGFEVEVLRVKWQSNPMQTYVVVDIETTGGSSTFHRITEIAALKVRDGEIIDQFHSLINPGRSIPAHITKITGITNSMVASAPRFSDIAEDFLNFTDQSIFVAHNVRFDYSFLQKEFQRLDLSFTRPQLCTVSGMRKAYPGLSSYSLKNLTDHFGIELTQHHRALCDAQAATELLFLINQIRSVHP